MATEVFGPGWALHKGDQYIHFLDEQVTSGISM